jgi:hypothetical protein
MVLKNSSHNSSDSKSSQITSSQMFTKALWDRQYYFSTCFKISCTVFFLNKPFNAIL